MLQKERYNPAETEWIDILKFFTHILKEFLVLQKRFPEMHVYLDTAEPIPFLVIEIDYDNLPKEDKDFLFGFGYRLNKALRTVFGEDIPFVEVLILNKVEDGKNLVKII
ncbi:hypothetical protein [Aquifex sp.]